MICNCFAIVFFPCGDFSEIREIQSKKEFYDHPTTNTIQSVVAIKGNFSGSFPY